MVDDADDILRYWEDSDFSDGAEFERMRARTKELLGLGIAIEGKQNHIVTEYFTSHLESWQGKSYTQLTFYPYERQAHRIAHRRKENGRFEDVRLIERKVLVLDSEEIDIDPDI